jgi:uncharacterized YccA/Bax inhibitor family protein
MKAKKSKAAPAAPAIETIRTQTSYKGARAFLGLPFILMGVISIFPATVSGLAIFSGGGFNPLAILPFIVALLSSLFCFGISALGNAVFDLADCAVRRDAMDRHAEALKAYKDYQAAQQL